MPQEGKYFLFGCRKTTLTLEEESALREKNTNVIYTVPWIFEHKGKFFYQFLLSKFVSLLPPVLTILSLCTLNMSQHLVIPPSFKPPKD